MVKHFAFEDISICKEHKPIVLFYSSTGAMGPIGLVLVMLDNKDIYVANTCRYNENGYKELIDTLFNEFPLLQSISMPLVKDHIKIPFSYDCIYFGYGNGALIDKEVVNKYKILDFRSFFDFINQIAKTDVLDVSLENILKEEK